MSDVKGIDMSAEDVLNLAEGLYLQMPVPIASAESKKSVAVLITAIIAVSTDLDDMGENSPLVIVMSSAAQAIYSIGYRDALKGTEEKND